MRWWTALATITLTGALAFGSVRMSSLHRPEYTPALLYFWLTEKDKDPLRLRSASPIISLDLGAH